MSNPIQNDIRELTSRINGPLSDLPETYRAFLFSELSILSYFDPEPSAAWGKTIGFTQIQRFDLPGDTSVTLFETATDVVVAFRGSYNVENFIQDFDFFLVRDGNLPGRVHEGFLGNFERLHAAIAPHLDTGRAIWATGHSLGGSLAAIMAVRASRNVGEPLAGVYTFAQPRIGNHDYVCGADPSMARYVNQFDIGPHLPPVLSGYRHFGTEFFINGRGKIVVVRNWRQNLVRLFDKLIGVLSMGIPDHSILKYRAALLSAAQSE